MTKAVGWILHHRHNRRSMGHHLPTYLIIKSPTLWHTTPIDTLHCVYNFNTFQMGEGVIVLYRIWRIHFGCDWHLVSQTLVYLLIWVLGLSIMTYANSTRSCAIMSSVTQWNSVLIVLVPILVLSNKLVLHPTCLRLMDVSIGFMFSLFSFFSIIVSTTIDKI